MSSKDINKNSKEIDNKYNKDSVFDKFDITDLITNDLLIPKISIDKFFYQKELHILSDNSYNSQNSRISTSSSEGTLQEIITKINNNSFGIRIDELILTFANDYKIPFIDLYTPIELIGQGGFGVVLSVIDKRKGKKIAAKIVLKSSHKEEFYLIEAELLQKLNHEKILKFYDVINTDEYLFIFTDLCEGGSLKDFIISRYNNSNDYFLKDSECSIIVKNLLQGIEYLSQNGVIHRDLKPENIMFKNKDDLNSLVICDLGIAGELKNKYSFMGSKCGTLTFMAPEIIMDRQYDNLVDIWSAGIIMFILESGGGHPLLFKPKTKTEFIKDIKLKKEYFFPNHFPLIARNIFLKMCKYEPCFRYDVTKSLHHPWITRQNKNIPLNVIEDLIKEEKIKNFKDMLISMIFLEHLKNKLRFHLVKTDIENELDPVKRKLNIRKGNININKNIYPTPFNFQCSIKKKRTSNSIRELPTLTRPSSSSKNERMRMYCYYNNINNIGNNNNNNNNNNNKGLLKLNSFNTDKKTSTTTMRYLIYPKNTSLDNNLNMNIKKSNTINTRYLSNRKPIDKKVYSKSKFNFINGNKNNNHMKLPAVPDSILDNVSQQIRTPILIKKQLSRNMDNNNQCLTIKMMKNKENLNLNYIYNNHNVINNYTNKKPSNNTNNKDYYKIASKAYLIEPKNLFQKPSNNNIITTKNSFDIVKKIF